MEFKITKKELRELEGVLSSGGRKFLVYHRDSDGLCSAALLLAFCPAAHASRTGPGIDDGFIRFMETEGPDVLIFLDLPVDQDIRGLSELKKRMENLRIVVIDHHIFERNLNKANLDILHINPRLHDRGSYIPTSCIVYRILQSIGKRVDDLMWIAAMGVIGDYGFEDCKKLISEFKKQHPKLLEGEILESRLARGARLIDSGLTLKGSWGGERVLELLAESDDFIQFYNSKELRRWEKEVGDEKERVARAAEKGVESLESLGLLIYTIESRLNLVSYISTYFSEKNPGRVVIVRKEMGGETKISARCQSGRVDVADLMKRSSRGIGSGGGHPKAGGAVVSDWNEFKRRVVAHLMKKRRVS